MTDDRSVLSPAIRRRQRSWNRFFIAPIVIILRARVVVESFHQPPPSPQFFSRSGAAAAQRRVAETSRRRSAAPPALSLLPPTHATKQQSLSRTMELRASSSSFDAATPNPSEAARPLVQIDDDNIWEQAALLLVNVEDNPDRLPDFVQLVSLLRVGLPSLAAAVVAKLVYPSAALVVADLIHGDKGVLEVVANDYSQYIQNILTTSGLVFSLLVGQTYYFMYQQQEKIYLALFEEVSVAKSLLEQVALVCQGRESLYHRILACIDRYVKHDLTSFNDADPAVLLSARPVDDPLENILFLTSVGEPSIVYQTVKSLRQARAYRLGALQRKLPGTHMLLLWSLAGIVLFTFPLLGAGSQTIGGMGILTVQSWYLSFIVFGIWLSLGVINELRKPGEQGAYNARTVLSTMVTGLEQELEQRMSGDLKLGAMVGPSIDSDGSFDADVLGPESRFF